MPHVINYYNVIVVQILNGIFNILHVKTKTTVTEINKNAPQKMITAKI